MSKGNSAEWLEDELDRAMARGRWLSDAEQAALDREADAEAFLVDAQPPRDRKLMLPTGVCLLIPPFWPVPPGLTLFLRDPETMARIGLAAAITFLVGHSTRRFSNLVFIGFLSRKSNINGGN